MFTRTALYTLVAAASFVLAGVQAGLVMQSIARFGTDDQRTRWLPGVADGSTRLSVAVDLTGAAEADAASSPRGG